MRVEAARFCLRSFQICKGFRFRSWYVGFQGLLAKLSKDLLTGLGAAVKCFGNHLGFARSLDACALGSCVWGADRAFGIRVPGSIAMSGVPRSNRVC